MSNESAPPALARLLDVLRAGLRDVRLSEKNEPSEITVKIVYPDATVTHTFCPEDANERKKI